VAAGAELVLSVNGSNVDCAREMAGTRTRVVVVRNSGHARDDRAHSRKDGRLASPI